MGYKQELDALGRWVLQVAGLKNHRLSGAPPQVARPVILWESPNRTSGRLLGGYKFMKKTAQYGKLFVNNLDELADIVDVLEQNLGQANQTLPIYESETAGAPVIGYLRNVEFDTNSSQIVDIPITVTYEVIYTRTQTETPAPPATTVTTRLRGSLVNE